MATTGIAAELLLDGTTVHSRIFKRKNVTASSEINIDRRSLLADMVNATHVMLIDEISMQNKAVLEHLDRLIRQVTWDPMLRRLPFGGKVFHFNIIFYITLLSLRLWSLAAIGNNKCQSYLGAQC